MSPEMEGFFPLSARLHGSRVRGSSGVPEVGYREEEESLADAGPTSAEKSTTTPLSGRGITAATATEARRHAKHRPMVPSMPNGRPSRSGRLVNSGANTACGRGH